MNRPPLPLNLTLVIAHLPRESDRIDFALAARRDGFDRPAYTCAPGYDDQDIATVRRAFDLSYRLRCED